MDDLIGHPITSRVAVGPRAGQKVFALQMVTPREAESRAGVAQYAGFSLHAGIGVEVDQRVKLERLARYVSRPPVAVERLALTVQGQVRYRLKSPYRDHGTEATMSDPLNNGLDEVPLDPGALSGQFRAGSLRNIAATAPYMHDGRFVTLREVIDHYSSGIKMTSNLHWRLRNRDAPRQFNFSEEDKAALEAFLHVLSDTSVLQDPKFSDPFD